MEEIEYTDNDALLKVEDLTVKFSTVSGTVTALRDISFSLRKGETIGILGESGSGKSTVGLSILGLLPSNAELTGNIYFNGKSVKSSGNEVRKLSKHQRKILSGNLQELRWKEISIIFQGAMNSFNPVYTIKRQIAEVFKLHTDLDDNEIDKKIIEVMKKANLDPKLRNSFPHEFSGGMKQRAMIAMALALDPKVVIADEPTTGLDVISQAEIIAELKKLKLSGEIESMIIISHDIGVVSALADRIVVLYAGKIMEIGNRDKIFNKTINPYSYALLDSYPSLKRARIEVTGIPGSLPDPTKEVKGCVFAERCSFAESICRTVEPKLEEVEPGHFSACHFGNKLVAKFVSKHESRSSSSDTFYSASGDIIEFQGLKKYYKIGHNVMGNLYSEGSTSRYVHAVDEISFSLSRGEVMAVIGESGSGKSTLGLTSILALQPTGGVLKFDVNQDNQLVEVPYKNVKSKLVKEYRKKMQMIFQDPYDSLDSKMKIFDIVSEPLYGFRKGDIKGNPEDLVKEALYISKLSPPERFMNLFPHELSGGERQRVSIARTVISKPEIIVADEPVSMLDVSIRASILNLLRSLAKENSLTLIYISHDIASARYISDKIAIMYLGKLVELGPTESVISNPLHPYTKALIKAVPIPSEEWNPNNLEIVGSVGNSIVLPKGCRFFERCIYRRDICKVEVPPLKGAPDHWYLCHFEQSQLTVTINRARDPVETHS